MQQKDKNKTRPGTATEAELSPCSQANKFSSELSTPEEVGERISRTTSQPSMTSWLSLAIAEPRVFEQAPYLSPQ
ncbi:hypothetical protein AAFF_G00246190 [Aldrovandia affinis]|uniref:Uncharacterized protein n=1 Tax=Aldrovandia affinis TaxID=143900 RepID=A0AAD7SVX5_9TELE|nr:hypothetical protein AAFF_G00246190 [Aldrovandia affinis]